MSAHPPRELVQIGSYLRQDQAEEHGLVVLAFGFDYWVLEGEGLYGLSVEAGNAGPASLELEKFEDEREAERTLAREVLAHQPPLTSLQQKPKSFSLFVFIWTMCLFFAIQRDQGPRWIELGAADSDDILHGEVWRTITALTLHADMGHLCANLTIGLVFAWALLPLFGSGWTWMGIVLSGALGNALNAVLHSGGVHRSIGASTAVFGGLGMLVGWQVVTAIDRFHEHRAHPWHMRGIVFPIGAGLALLAFLGVGHGNDNVDILAHGSGMLAGIVLGVLAAWTRLPERTTVRVQHMLALGALLLPALAWLLAVYV